MNRTTKALVLTVAITAMSLAAMAADKNPIVGGKEMFPTKNIVENAVNSADHTTLVAAVKAAGLVETLQSPGPFTLFAPVNQAFEKLPKGTMENLLKAENKEMLKKILTYHVVAGRLSATDLRKQIKSGYGSATLKKGSRGSLNVLFTLTKPPP